MADIYSVNVAGESYRQAEIARTREGEHVHLIHDVENRHDPRAVAVFSARSELIGFLPRGGWLTDAIRDDGRDCTAWIGKIHPATGGRRFAAVVLSIELL